MKTRILYFPLYNKHVCLDYNTAMNEAIKESCIYMEKRDVAARAYALGRMDGIDALKKELNEAEILILEKDTAE